ncbi:MAG: hypothetical protein Q4G10_03730 [Bacteroidia bacterium]|nr:hypothetical protein [Bacteroidia bacterium]
MGMFNWFGEQEHNTFDYKPIYYDKEKDELKQKFGKVDGSAEKEAEQKPYVPGSYIKGSLRDGNYQKSVRAGNKAQNIIGLVGLVLVIVALMYIAKFFTIL